MPARPPADVAEQQEAEEARPPSPELAQERTEPPHPRLCHARRWADHPRLCARVATTGSGLPPARAHRCARRNPARSPRDQDHDRREHLVLSHADNLLTVYANIDNLDVEKGARCRAGKVHRQGCRRRSQLPAFRSPQRSGQRRPDAVSELRPARGVQRARDRRIMTRQLSGAASAAGNGVHSRHRTASTAVRSPPAASLAPMAPAVRNAW